MAAQDKTNWYAGGLHFGCRGCGDCCSGPGEGYIWITRDEIELLADYLKVTPGELRRNYLKRLGHRTSIIEDKATKDCIFLQKVDSEKKCTIYSVRPNQCRTWPFWASNLERPGSWNHAGQRCPGINQGKGYKLKDILRLKKQKRWWSDE
jgi:hypothetical protein